MGRKVRSVILLILVLVLIYTQQAVIYAQNDIEISEETEEKSDEEKNLKSSGEEEDDKKEPEKQEIQKYTLLFPQADGNHGYYVTKPEVTMIHNGSFGATVYELKHEDQVLAQGRIEYGSEEEPQVVLDRELFWEGRNILHITMEDEDGNSVPEYEAFAEFLIDTRKPELNVTAPEGLFSWYQNEVWISVTATDGSDGSQLAQMVCYENNQILGKSNDEQAKFRITQTCEKGTGTPVTIAAVDIAGNKTERTVLLYIDRLAPEINMAGARDYMITSQPVTVEYQVKDENYLENALAVIEHEKPEGEKSQKQISSRDNWETGERSARMIGTFEEDGIYQIRVQAVDGAKQRSEKCLQFIIDSQNPVIKMVDELQGKYMKKFSWDYPTESFIKDFTTFEHQIQLDGQLYPSGTEIYTEGRHTLQVNATDAAGNQSVAKAEFVIDHTPPEIHFFQAEEGVQYEGSLRFQVNTGREEDWIEEILINGKGQTLKRENGKYTFHMTEPGDYEVYVRARDFAGNQSEKEVTFEVIPEKTIIQKAVEPVERILFGHSETEQGRIQKKDEKSNFVTLPGIAIGSITIVLFVMIAKIWHLNKCKKQKSRKGKD